MIRFVGLLAGAFVVIHVGALLLESYLPFSLTNLVVPGTAPYRPVAVAIGVLAAELLAALALTNRYRKALSYGFWRRAHYLNFAVWLLGLYIGTASVVTGLTASRSADTLTAWTNVQLSRQSSPFAGRLPDQ